MGKVLGHFKSFATLISTLCVSEALKMVYSYYKTWFVSRLEIQLCVEWQFYFYCLVISHCPFLLPVCGRYAFVHVTESVHNMFQISIFYLV